MCTASSASFAPPGCWMRNPTSPLEREILSGRPVVTMTSGDSMEPLLFHQSTRVVIRNVEGDLKKGDLPVYRRPSGQFVMHRIIRVNPDTYYTRGDNRYGLERVPKDWVLGIVTEIYRKNRHFSVTDWRYRLYVSLWNFLYPLRYLAYRGKSWIRRKRH